MTSSRVLGYRTHNSGAKNNVRTQLPWSQLHRSLRTYADVTFPMTRRTRRFRAMSSNGECARLVLIHSAHEAVATTIGCGYAYA